MNYRDSPLRITLLRLLLAAPALCVRQLSASLGQSGAGSQI